MLEKFSESGRRILGLAQEEAFSLHYSMIEPDLLLLGLLRDKESRAIEILHALSVDEAALYQRMHTALAANEPLPAERTVTISEGSKRIITRMAQARKLPVGVMSSEDFLLSLLQEEEGFGLKLLREAGVSFERVKEQIRLLASASGGEKEAQEAKRRTKKLARLQFCFLLGWTCTFLVLFYALVQHIDQVGTTIAHVLIALFRAAPFLLVQLRPEWLPWIALLIGIFGYLIWFVIAFPLYWAYGVLFPQLRRKTKIKHLFRRWLRAYCLKNVISMLTLLLSLEVIYAFFAFFPSTWWLWSTLYYTLFSLLMVYTRPMLIFPLFYKMTPIHEGPLLDCFHLLLKRTNTHIDGLYLLESKGVKVAGTYMVANALLAFWGRQKRVMVTDYVYHRFPVNEVEVILAHELGHLVHKDILKRALLRGFLVGVFLLTCQFLMGGAVDAGGRLIHLIMLIAKDPFSSLLIGYWFSLGFYGFYQWVHRYDEYRADEYALQVTGKVEMFKKAMSHLSSVSILPTKRSQIRSLFATHPTLSQRLKHADEFAKKNQSVPDA
jgi:STE24 endopeptidase